MQLLIVLQSEYYFLTGLWPIVHMASFEKVTGPKTNKWLVKLVGLLAASIGVVLMFAQAKSDVKLLGILAAASFAAIDFYYAIQRTIRPIYLVEGLVQVFFIGFWLVV
jgi:energy-converting hydrogenase Eha subunit E